jgi:hypothetical protein
MRIFIICTKSSLSSVWWCTFITVFLCYWPWIKHNFLSSTNSTLWTPFRSLFTVKKAPPKSWFFSIESEYRLNDRCLIPGRGKRFFLYPLCPDQLWSPPSLLFIGYWGVNRGWVMMLTTRLRPVPWSRMSRSYTPRLLSTCMACMGQLYFFTFASHVSCSLFHSEISSSPFETDISTT